MFRQLFPCKYPCAYSSSCAQITVHSNVFLWWQTCSRHVHLYFSHCLHVFTACMFIYSLHVVSACLFMFLLHVFSAYYHQHMSIVNDNRSTDVQWIVSMQVFMRILIIMCTYYCTLHCRFCFKIVVHTYMYTFTIVCMYSLHPCSCNHSMFSVHTITNIFASSTTTDRLMFHELFLRIVSMQVFRRILIIICTYWCSLYCRCVLLKLVVHMCLYTFTIACTYSLNACSCIHSMFSVHISTNISASSSTTDRLVFHELFPCMYSCAYSSSCAHTIAHYIVVDFVNKL